jgi:hypothetical protein
MALDRYPEAIVLFIQVRRLSTLFGRVELHVYGRNREIGHIAIG